MQPANKHREVIEPITLWEKADMSKAHPDIEVLRVLSFQRDNGDIFIVDRYLERARRASLKAGGSGIMHRVMAYAKPTDEQSCESQSYQFKLYQDDIEWYIEHDLPEDNPNDYVAPGSFSSEGITYTDDGQLDETTDDNHFEFEDDAPDPDFGDAPPDPDFEDEERAELDPNDIFIVVEDDDGSDDAVSRFYI